MPAGLSATFAPTQGAQLTKDARKRMALEKDALELYGQYGERSHALGNLLIELMLNKGKFNRELGIKKVKFSVSDAANYDPGRHQQPTNGW